MTKRYGRYDKNSFRVFFVPEEIILLYRKKIPMPIIPISLEKTDKPNKKTDKKNNPCFSFSILSR
jgi:hypothetical protein